ncbi:hypothetical protein OAM98_06005 [Schleiferiaceae bacterium]|nr:hypothetical protein [Schleiferiaceae bacterium]
MEIITMEMEAYKSLIKKIDRVYDEIKILQNPADQIQREWCSTSEAAKVLGVTVRTVYSGERGNRTLGDFVFYRCHEFLVLLSKPYKHRA